MKNLKKMISVFLVVAMVLSSNVLAMAATDDSSTPGFEGSYGDITREEALEMLGITEEEAEGLQLYEFSEGYPNGRNIPNPINPGTYYEDMLISGGFTGAPHVCYGNKLKWAVGLRSKGTGQFCIGLSSYDSNLISGAYWSPNLSAGQNYTSEWYNIYSGATMYFRYVYTNYDNVNANFRIIVAVANV